MASEKVDIEQLKALQSAGVSKASFDAKGRLLAVEFFETQTPVQFTLPAGVEIDQTTKDVIEELTGEERRRREQKKRDELLYHSS